MSFLSPDTQSASSALSQVNLDAGKRNTLLGGPEDDIQPFSTPQGKKPGNKNQRTTFLGAEMTPGPTSSPMGKTLLGL